MHASSAGSRLVRFHHRNGIKSHARGQHEPVATPQTARSFHDPLTESGRRRRTWPLADREFVGGLGLILLATVVSLLVWAALSRSLDPSDPPRTPTREVSR